MLAIRDLSVSFGGLKAVDGVSLDVAEGEIFTIIGPNGAGKTTLFNLVSRLVPASAGSILFEGRDLREVPPQRIARLGIARTFQNIELFEHASVTDNLLLGCHVGRRTTTLAEMLYLPAVRAQERAFRRKVEEIIDFLDLAHHRESSIASLAYGVRKVVELGRALAISPRLLLLDEPSSGLNPEETGDMAHWIRDIRDDLGVTIVMVEHDMALVSRVSDRVLVMESGRVLALGTAAEVTADPRVVRAYLGD